MVSSKKMQVSGFGVRDWLGSQSDQRMMFGPSAVAASLKRSGLRGAMRSWMLCEAKSGLRALRIMDSSVGPEEPTTMRGRAVSMPIMVASWSAPSTWSAMTALSHFMVPVTSTRSGGADMATKRSA